MNNECTEEAGLPKAPSKIWTWVEKKAKSPHALWWLGLYSFLESSPILLPPTDIFLSIMVLAKKKQAVMLAVFTTVTSVMGGVFAYIVAYFFFQIIAEPIIAWMGIAEQVASASVLLNDYTFFATLAGALTPIPYTPVAFAAGFLKVHFLLFVAASFVGRAIRYGAVTFIVYFFGSAILPRCGKYANRITGLIVILALIVFVLYFLFQILL